MQVLITGVCGFVGSVLARGFRERHSAWKILGVDNFSRAGSELNRRELAALGVQVIHADIRLPADLAGLPVCEWIVDAAANPSVLAGVDARSTSAQLIGNNLGGTLALLELAKSWRSGLILLSTSRVYSLRELTQIPLVAGECRLTPQHPATVAGLGEAGIAEEFSTEPPLSLYGVSKRASELVALEYGATFDLPVFVNRCGVLAGPGQFGRGDQGIFSFWIHSWCQKRPLRYLGYGGRGLQVRDCLDAQDLVPLLAMQMNDPARPGPRVLNVSGGLPNSASLRELSDWCAGRFGPHPVGAEESTRPFDVPWLVLDATRCERLWNWKPQTSIEQIFERISQHAEANPRWLEFTAA